MKIKESRLRQVIRETIYRELGRQAINEGRVNELFGLFGGGGDKIELGDAAAQELKFYKPESGGIGKHVQDAINAGLDDFFVIQQALEGLNKALVDGGKALNAKDKVVKRVKDRFEGGSAAAGNKASGAMDAMWKMIFEKESSLPVIRAIEAATKRAK